MIPKLKKILKKLHDLSKENQEYLENCDENEQADKMYLMGFADGIAYSINKIKPLIRDEELLEDDEMPIENKYEGEN